MFNITTVNEIQIESSWKRELSVSSQSCQCDPYYTRDEGSQYPVVSAIGIQSFSSDSSSAVCSGRYVQERDSILKDIDLVRLNDFLRRGEKLTQREIRKSIENDDWKPINRIHGTSGADVRCLHKIYSDHLFTEVGSEKNKEQQHQEGEQRQDYKKNEVMASNKYIVSYLTWNCTSSMIAVSYEVNVDHSKSWCSHESFLCLWNLFRKLDHESKPSVTLAIDGCITCVSAHPRLATIYAIGTRSGKVFVVNSRFSASRQISKSTTCQASFSSSGSYMRSSNPPSVHHSDSVSSIHWISGARLDHQQLVSVGADGKIFVWLMDGSSLEEEGKDDTKDLILSQAFVILVESVGLRPNVARVAQQQQQQRRGSKSYLPSSPSSSNSERRSSITKEIVPSSSFKTDESSSPSELGIVSSSFSREDPFNFLVGCVGGSLFLCSLDTQPGQQNTDPFLRSYNAQEKTGKNISFTSPVRVSYVSHRSNVNSVEFCWTSRNLFLSGSVDGEVRVYNLLDVKPLAILHVESGLRSASWSAEAVYETRNSTPVTKRGSSEFETSLYCLLQNGLLASFRFSLVVPASSSSSSHSAASSQLPSSSSSPISSSLFEENNKLHTIAEFPLPSDDQTTQRISHFSFNHSGKKEGERLISISTGRGLVSVWQLL